MMKFVLNENKYTFKRRIMKIKIKTLTGFSLLVLFGLLIISGCEKESLLKTEQDLETKSSPNQQNNILAEIRKETAKYHNINAAIADGYNLDPHCVEHPVYGGMGHHAVNMDRIGPFVNPAVPGVLVYEPTRNGRYRLVAVEYIVPAEPWDAMNDGFPMLGNVEFDDHREILFVELLDDEGNVVFDEVGDPVVVPVNAKGGPPFPHYQLHVWVWRNNPNGMYAPFNPKVSCTFSEN